MRENCIQKSGILRAISWGFAHCGLWGFEAKHFFLSLCWDAFALLEMPSPDRGTQSSAAHGAVQLDFRSHFCFCLLVGLPTET